MDKLEDLKIEHYYHSHEAGEADSRGGDSGKEGRQVNLEALHEELQALSQLLIQSSLGIYKTTRMEPRNALPLVFLEIFVVRWALLTLFDIMHDSHFGDDHYETFAAGGEECSSPRRRPISRESSDDNLAGMVGSPRHRRGSYCSKRSHREAPIHAVTYTTAEMLVIHCLQDWLSSRYSFVQRHHIAGDGMAGEDEEVSQLPYADILEESEEFHSIPGVPSLWTRLNHSRSLSTLVHHKEIEATKVLKLSRLLQSWHPVWLTVKDGYVRVYKAEEDIGKTLCHDTLPLADFMIEDAQDAVNEESFIIRLVPEFEGDVIHTVSLPSEELKMLWLERLQHRKVEQEEHRMHLQESEDQVSADEEGAYEEECEETGKHAAGGLGGAPPGSSSSMSKKAEGVKGPGGIPQGSMQQDGKGGACSCVVM